MPDSTAEHAYDLGLAGWEDQDAYAFAQPRNALIVTYDEDFADQRLFPVGSHHDIVRLRVEPTMAEETIAALNRLLSAYKVKDLKGKLVIVGRNRIRVIPD